MGIVLNSRSNNPGSTGFNCIHLTSDAAGGTIYLPLNALYISGNVQNYMTFQTSGPGTASYSLTLYPEQESTNPDPTVQATVGWTAPVALPQNTMFSPPNQYVAVAMKVVMTGASELFIAII